MNNIMQLTQVISQIESNALKNEKDRPYAILCLFVLRQAINDAHPHHSNHSRQHTNSQTIRKARPISEDAKKFLGGKGLEVWLKASGIKCITAQHIRSLAEHPHRMYFARQDDHDFDKI